MKPSTTSPDSTALTTATTAPSKDGVVVTGVFESVLSVQQLAAELHVSAQTIYDLHSQGRGPTGFRVGRHLRFRKSEIEGWLARLEGEDCDRHSGESR
ncbi:MAG: helix-turn-helix domain-containing protein [Nocardioides sp.]|uniref:helix-turn-helix transcriptional regulator n=1 Tax=Nocardioides sp. TaxID=35761 RepID=UPI003264CFBC